MSFNTSLESLAQRADPIFYVKDAAIAKTEFLQGVNTLRLHFYNTPAQR